MSVYKDIKTGLEQAIAYEKESADSRYNFDEDTKALIEAFAKINITLRDENGNYRNTHDVLTDMNENYNKL